MARILVIEDDAHTRELVTYLLGAFGHVTRAAADGPAGLVQARAEPPDLILCDVQLPGIDGFGVAQALMSDAALAAIPRVAVTASAMVGDRDKLLAGGFHGYLSKPITPETFVQQVDAFLPLELRAPARRGA